MKAQHNFQSGVFKRYHLLNLIRFMSFVNMVIILSGISSNAQGLINNGSRILINSGAYLVIDGGPATGNFTNQDNVGTGIVENNGILSVSGNWTNNSAQYVFTTNTGTVNLAGSTQTIGGSTSTYFNNLSFTGAGTKTLNVNTLTGGGFASPAGVLSLAASNLDLNMRTLTISNSSNSAITRTTGMIISETDALTGYGIVKWNMGTSTGNYVYPFGNSVSASYLPFNFNKTTAGSGSGTLAVSVSTYPTVTGANPNNRPLPTGVVHLNNALNADNSAKVLDRFWVIDVQNYSVKPVADITMTYRDSEHNTSGGSTNLITESQLMAQRWNGLQWQAPSGTVNTTTNTVTVMGVNDFNSVWALASSSSPLPVELLSFHALLNNENKVDLTWETATELNNDYFTMERSQDGITFETLGIVQGAGNSTFILNYAGLDPHPYMGVTYYRLKQTDFNGAFSYSQIEKVHLEGTTATGIPVTVTLFPNPATDVLNIVSETDLSGSTIHILNSLGQQVKQPVIIQDSGEMSILIRIVDLAPGVYFIQMEKDGRTSVNRFIKR